VGIKRRTAYLFVSIATMAFLAVMRTRATAASAVFSCNPPINMTDNDARNASQDEEYDKILKFH
ncbi:MAG: hypothetical protein K2H92_02385, partial [Bacteroidaceae bacterium]|nr:hypothetical protein [Bacteroidaceae bacterium]